MPVIDPKNIEIEWRGRDRNIEHRTLISSEKYDCEMALWEIHAPQSTGAPPHVHRHDETITVLSGTIKAQIDREVVEVHSGQTLFIPANAGHSFGAISEEDAHLLIAFPVGEPTWESIDWKTWLADK